jgi:DNA-binding helix-hairpin-helix protein with protein kinase domain
VSTRLVTKGALVGRGGEGDVYEIPDQPELVAKAYHKPPSPERIAKLTRCAGFMA